MINAVVLMAVLAGSPTCEELAAKATVSGTTQVSFGATLMTYGLATVAWAGYSISQGNTQGAKAPGLVGAVFVAGGGALLTEGRKLLGKAAVLDCRWLEEKAAPKRAQ